MLHTKFQGHWSIGSGGEDFKGFYHGYGSTFGHVTQLIRSHFHSHSPITFHIKFGSKRLNSFREKQVLSLK